MTSDDELLRAWRAGERAAGTALFDRYADRIATFFANRGCVPQDTEDLVQRTFVATAEGIHRYRGTASVRTWMFAIAHNILRQWKIERSRRRGREDALRETLADEGVGLSTILHSQQERRILLEALRSLDLETQLLLQLRYWTDIPAREIGEILGCSEAATRNRLRKAKQDLLGVLDSFSRERPALESTCTSLEDWARQLRADWGA